ncbi:hypothetical protein [Murimonas intestini]|uniref:Nif11-like leader peptide family natural product n=1 Tax=Murimonas intestini TaxID=1337051 RepID=A0AB73T2I0_9FIRM|nr:hypothetical protein [Murimonas intestini]MCR1842627.1 hypothetical protein [Murimonas intestini]MCR1867326.1 hypothetical protein [Murimonas intestini]MCR1884513.1 hypothetical protein [Murimonas intestini]
MKELIQKLKETNRLEALDSLESLQKAAGELGFTEEDVMKFMEDFKGFPLDDDDVEEITGGIGAPPASRVKRGSML